ncbi:Qat anti-phage system QueC-like protein QatC [Pontibacillus marinus]|uniref:7-cyano-7-deazaguanine synthase n=1 Tax=Pontibacillus marinus BH030004 = DSM 16465 TaxID=1385511 RepID=A0A0A5FZR2_9BACI|nr:Qat anti-phage system QueC-like protein QatC [Pontibacillus marinus]KGX84323.1 ATPase [Pontibacillus marinus BH030004 = DSM 16465]
MRKAIFNCKYTEESDYELSKNAFEYNINDSNVFSYTFLKETKTTLPAFYSNTGLDLFYLSLFVYGADRIIKRSSFKDGWTRSFKLNLPVLEKDIWDVNKNHVEKMLSFLTGDKWEINFFSRNLTKDELSVKKKIEDDPENIIIEEFCMFSGGLDSFIGAIDLIEENKQKNKQSGIHFISHYAGGKGTKEFQDILRNKLKSKFGLEGNNFSSYYAVARNGIEDTTRSRSLMFFGHAIALASCMREKVELIIPENGMISLNVPLTNSRLGTSSTRTTHPHYINMLQELLSNLGLKISITNPYQFKTKGEMIKECKNIDFLYENIVNTMSCSHPDIGRMKKEKESCHCGYCLPCVIRRAAVKRAGLEDPTTYRDVNFNSGPTAKLNYSSYSLGLKKQNKNYSFLRIQNSGPIYKDVDYYAFLYKRGLKELSEFLEDL